MKTIAEYLELFGNENTRKNQQAAIYSFLDFIYGKQRQGVKASEEEKQRYEQLVRDYFSTERDYFEDLLRFAAEQNKNKVAPYTARSRITCLRGFFNLFKGIEFTRMQEKQIRNRLPKGKARTVEKELTGDKIRAFTQHMDVKGRALVLTLVSSGMRIDETLQLELSDIDLDKEPVKITVRQEYTKTGEKRICFISSEASESLREWLKVRDKYLQSAQYKNNGLVKSKLSKQKDIEDNRVFPFSQKTANDMLNNALKKAGLWSVDKNTKRKQISYHHFRKFFLSQLKKGCPIEIAEALAGHSGYLSEAYRRYTESELAEEYKQAEHHVTIGKVQNIESIKAEVKKDLTHEVKAEYLEDLLDLRRENQELKRQLNDLQEKIAIIYENLKLKPKETADEMINAVDEVKNKE